MNDIAMDFAVLNTFDLPYVFDFYVCVFYILVFEIAAVKTDNEPAMAHFICTHVYWLENVHAGVIVWWLMCHVGSLSVNKILTY